MNRIFFAFTVMFFVFEVSSSAAIHKGQRFFVKECASCHNGGQAFIGKKTVREWEKLMDNKGKELADLHLKEENAKDSHSYFQSNTYEKRTKHLQDFLVEYAKDSGNVPACN